MPSHKGAQIPNWGPPIRTSSSELHRIGVQTAIESRGGLESSTNGPETRRSAAADSNLRGDRAAHIMRDRLGPSARPSKPSTSKAASSPYRPGVATRKAQQSSGLSSEESDPSSEDEEASFLSPHPFRSSNYSTGNHFELAASSTAGFTALPRRTAHRLPERALERLDKWAARVGTSNKGSDTEASKRVRRMHPSRADDSFEPTYIMGKPSRNVHSSPPARQRRPGSPPITGHALDPIQPMYQPDLSAPSAFTVLADKIGKGLHLAEQQQQQQRPMRGDSSAETLVDAPGVDAGPTNQYGYAKDQDDYGPLLLPSGVQMGRGAYAGLALPDDVTGLTSAMGSPVKTRQGVDHARLNPRIGNKHLADRRARLSELRSFVVAIEEELESTKDRLDGVEQREQELRGDVSEIKEELLGKHRRAQAYPERPASHTAVPTVESHKPSSGSGPSKKPSHTASNPQGGEGWTEKFATMTNHVNALSADLQAYRAAVDRMQSWHDEVPPVADGVVASRSDDGQDESLERAEEYESLKAQVDQIELEVHRLQSVVETQQSSSSLAEARRKGSDVTPVAAAPRGAAFSRQSKQAPGPADRKHQPSARFADEGSDGGADSDADVTQAAERVEQSVRTVRHDATHQWTADLEHNALDCTVCLSQDKAQAKRASRRERIANNVRRQDHGEREEDLLLSFLSAGADKAEGGDRHASRSLSGSQRTLLRSLIRQHLDEFIHQRMLYAELADEVKGMHPDSMNRSRRKILIEHLMDAVEDLEAKARRIELLKRLMPREDKTMEAGHTLQEGERSRRDPSAKRHGSSATRAKTSTVAPEKMHRGHTLGSDVEVRPLRPQPTTLSRALANSPPMVDRLAGLERERRTRR
ncbi:unnamed protein product [Parajaminaea phylloscopi]